MGKRKKSSGRLKNLSNLVIISFLFLFQSQTPAQISITEAFPNLEFTAPVDIQNSGDSTNRLFVLEQEGIIRVFRNSPDVTESKVFLDIRDEVKSGGEMGLLGLAFHPEYEKNGYFFVNYTTGDPEDRTIISRFQVSSDPDSADQNSELRILRQIQPNVNHNGGQLAFGPDGYLYIALGDGGSYGDPDNNAQRLNTALGKILRINIDSTYGDLHFVIPPDNPFKGNLSGYREEIYAYGFRNPWRFSFDTLTGQIWCADVGQGNWEEINLVISGGNYGWRIKEGNHCFDPPDNCDTAIGLINPIWEYGHENQGGSVTGGFVYRGAENPELYGKYIYADFMQNKIWVLTYDSIHGANNELLSDAPGAITSFGIDENQELYFCAFTISGNKLYKFTTATSVDDDSDRKDYSLFAAYPNPFNPSTMIRYNIPEESYLKIEVFNTTGEKIITLKNEITERGTHEIKWDASRLASGMYLIRLEAISLINSRIYLKNIKALLIK